MRTNIDDLNENNILENDVNLHPGVLYFYSESIAFAVNGICAFLACLANFGAVTDESSSKSLIGFMFIVLGGVIQYLASLRSFRANEHFGATVLSVFSALWFLLGFEMVLGGSEDDASLPNKLMVACLGQSVLLLAISPFLNAFYMCLMAAITGTVVIEIISRFQGDTGADLSIFHGVVHLLLSFICGYGCVASICRSIHERQVLPGFDDAVIESVLWKRKANVQNYTDGKWANPKPLLYFSTSMTMIGVCYLLEPDYDKGDQFSIANPVLVCWFTVQAFLQWTAVFIFGLRQEILHMADALMNSLLSAIVSYSLYMSVDIYIIVGTDAGAWIFLLLGLVRLSFTALDIEISSLTSTSDRTFVDILASSLLTLSLIVISIGAWFENTNVILLRCSEVLLFACTLVTLYSACAEVLNSSAQKQLLPVTFDLFKKKEETLDLEIQASSEDTFELDYDVEATLRNRVEDGTTFVPPGDENLFGKSDFESPISLFFIAISIYFGMKCIGLFMSASNEASDSATRFVLVSALANIILQTPVLIIVGARGQTSLGVLSFSFWLDGIALLALSPSSTSLDLGQKIILSVPKMAVQLAWVFPSNSQTFQPLIIVILLHLVTLATEIMEGIPTIGNIFVFLSAFLSALLSVFCLFLSGLLLGCHKNVKVFTKFYSQTFQKDANRILGTTSHSLGVGSRCPYMASQHISGFLECIEILNNGGVCCIPTDTVYCLATKANNPEGIRRIYDIKNRPSEKPLSLWVSSLDDIKAVGPEGPGWSAKLFAFMDEIWPGSVSLVVSRGEWLNRFGVGSSADLIGTADSIALRVPNSTLTVSLLKLTGPLAITSANPSGACDCTHHNKVDDIIASKIDFILADGPSPMTIASSVIDVRELDSNKIFFYRVGCVPESEIWQKLRDVDHTDKECLCANIPTQNLKKVKAMMNLILESIHCDSWRIYCLHPWISDKNDGDDKATVIPQMRFASSNRRLQNVFENGISVYPVNKDEILRDGKSEMLLPINDRLGVAAVLSIVNKRNSDGSLQPFDGNDIQIANLACTLVKEDIDVWNVKQCLDDLCVVTFGEDSSQLISSLLMQDSSENAALLLTN